MKHPDAQYLITANRTDDGSVVYLLEDGKWTASLNEAALWPSEEAATPALGPAKAEEGVVCDPYLAPANREGDQVVLRSARERIRANGPTTRLRRPDVQPGA